MSVGHILVMGAGNGGLAAAAELGRRGYPVALYNRSPEPLEPVQAQGGVRYEGVIGEGFAPVRTITTDLAGVVAAADLILICVPATGHSFMAQALAPHLRSGQPVVLNPGGLLGCLDFARELRQAGFSGQIRLAETCTLPYICRQPTPGVIRVTGILKDLPFAALPGRETPRLAEEVRGPLPNILPVPHILATGLANVNAVLHPPAMIFAAAWIEQTGGDFYYYYDAATPSVGRLLKALDNERLTVAAAWQVEVEPFVAFFARIGSTSPEAAASGDPQRVLLESQPNRHIKAPPSLDHRYMHEDIPYGVVPVADLGRAAGVATPVMDAVITLASVATGRDFRAEGRTLARVGLRGLPVGEVLRQIWEEEP